MEHSKKVVVALSASTERHRVRKILLGLGAEVEVVKPEWLKSVLIGREKYHSLVCDSVSFNAETKRILSKYQPLMAERVLLVSCEFKKGNELDSAFRYIKEGVLMPILLPCSDAELNSSVQLALNEWQSLRKFGQCLIGGGRASFSSRFLNRMSQSELLRGLVQFWLLKQSQLDGFHEDNVAREFLESLQRKYPLSQLIGHFSISKMFQVGDVSMAYASSKRLFNGYQRPVYFDLTFRICKDDYNQSGKKCLGRDFIGSFDESKRSKDNFYYRTLIGWYCENLKVWRDLKFLSEQNLKESLLAEEILPSLIPFLQKMKGLVTRRSKNHWIRQKLLPVLRGGIDLGLYLEPTNEILLEMALDIDEHFQTMEALPAFGYARGLRSSRPQFHLVLAKYCLYLSDVKEASIAIRRAQILGGDQEGVTSLKQKWLGMYELKKAG